MLLATLAGLTLLNVGSISIDKLYKQSPLIVTAKVREQNIRHMRIEIATADVIQVHKGDPKIKQVDFVAQATWPCDISVALPNETVLLYLQNYDGDNGVHRQVKYAVDDYKLNGNTLYLIGHDGRGRLPIKDGKVETISFKPGTWSVNTELGLPDNKKVKAITTEKGLIKISDLLSYR